MKNLLPALFLALVLTELTRAAPPEPIDLGANLAYLHIKSLADAAPLLSTAQSAQRPLVLDLRYATSEAAALSVFQTALARHPAPLFILFSTATPQEIIAVVKQSAGAIITLSVAGADAPAQIQVKADPAADRLAYEALGQGTLPAILVTGKIEKERFDEATLVQEFKNGNPDAEPPPLPDPTQPKLNQAAPVKAPLIDRVLQRAIQLHRALLALENRR
ncbi:MAG: hypothetical protein EBT62_04080 [Opitutaceae bacterium]|nr:hypothetical protein [Opitutaceae bacterium]